MKALKARQEGDRNTLVVRQTVLNNKLVTVKRSQEQRTAAITNATNELNKATATLATAKLAAKATATTLEEKRTAADRATDYADHLAHRVTAIQGEIDKVTAIRDKAARLQGQLSNLTAKLANAESDKATADKRVADAKVAYAQAQKALSNAKSNVQRLTGILAIDKALTVYQDAKGTVSAVTRETPTVTPVERPAFDLNAELKGYKVTQNEDGIGATTVDTPTVTPTERPAFDLNGELNGYKVTQNEDGIGAVLSDTLTQTLPTFDPNIVNNHEQPNVNVLTPKPDLTSRLTIEQVQLVAGNNKKENESIETVSVNKDSTKKELPNTGSYSRVERQIALGGYTMLGLSLGILGFSIPRKRKR